MHQSGAYLWHQLKSNCEETDSRMTVMSRLSKTHEIKIARVLEAARKRGDFDHISGHVNAGSLFGVLLLSAIYIIPRIRKDYYSFFAKVFLNIVGSVGIRRRRLCYLFCRLAINLDAFEVDFRISRNRAIFQYIVDNVEKGQSKDFQDLFVAYRAAKGEITSFIGFGEYDGVFASNTFYLEKEGLSGLVIEANPEHAAKLQMRRPKSKVISKAIVVNQDCAEKNELFIPRNTRSSSAFRVVSLEGLREEGKLIEVETITVAKVLEIFREHYGDEFSGTYVSLDIEGDEEKILEEMFKFGVFPAIISIEHNFNESKRAYIKSICKERYECELEYLFRNDLVFRLKGISILNQTR